MDETTHLQTLLTRAAEDLGEVQPPTADDFRARRRQRRHRSVSALSAVAVTVAIAATLVVTRHAPKAPETRPAPVTAADLAAGHWSTLPPAPIKPRLGAASVWTGHEMLVWGGGAGDNRSPFVNTGAAYDPATHRWTMLPASPLSPRTQMSSVWTGKYWFIWGGYISSSAASASDGALYDPATHTWRMLPMAPVANSGYPTAVWNGNQVIVLSAPRADNVFALHTEAFNPASNRWTALPDIVEPKTHPLVSFVALATGSDVSVFYEWNRTIPLGGGSETARQGVDGFVLHQLSTSWTSDSRLVRGLQAAEGALWTGSRVFVPSAQPCWSCYGGIYSGPLGGVLIDPGTGSKTALSAGPAAEEQRASYLWAGQALLAFNFTAGFSGPANSAALWDPKTNAWTTIAKAPQGIDVGYGSNAVWTGSHLLVWGEPATNHPVELGLQFGP